MAAAVRPRLPSRDGLRTVSFARSALEHRFFPLTLAASTLPGQ